MLGLGWTEMLVVGVVALIVIGPKDLPVVMNRIGKFAGMVRRMGNEFQREINRSAGLDEVRSLRNSITQPLKQTTDEIRREFNAIGTNGAVKPSGVIKPADPKAESVVDEIHAAAGLNASATTTAPTPVTSTLVGPAIAAGSEPVMTKVVRAKRPVKLAAGPDSPVTSSELLPDGLSVAQPVRTRRSSAKLIEPVASSEPVAPKRRAPRKSAEVQAAAPSPEKPE